MQTYNTGSLPIDLVVTLFFCVVLYVTWTKPEFVVFWVKNVSRGFFGRVAENPANHAMVIWVTRITIILPLLGFGLPILSWLIRNAIYLISH
jgi:hypothetical protein